MLDLALPLGILLCESAGWSIHLSGYIVGLGQRHAKLEWIGFSVRRDHCRFVNPLCDACMLLLTDTFFLAAVACVCLVAVVVGAVVMRQRKQQSKASKPDEAWYQLEVANPLCT